MKNLLISKSFSYEIVNFSLLWQSNTYHLGGGRSIQLNYENLYEKLANWQVIHLLNYTFIFLYTVKIPITLLIIIYKLIFFNP